MLVTSIFSFSYNIFKRLIPQECQKSPLCHTRLTLSQITNFIDSSKPKVFADNSFRFDENGKKFLTFSRMSPGILHVCSTSLLKTLWEKEKFIVVSNFSFSHIVFYPFGELSTIFIEFKIALCKVCLQFEASEICCLEKG